MSKKAINYIALFLIVFSLKIGTRLIFDADESKVTYQGGYEKRKYTPSEETKQKHFLKRAAEQMSYNCPILVDENTRLDKVIGVGHEGLQYNYTLLNYSKDSIGFDALKEGLTPGLVKYVRETPELEPYRDRLIKFQYHYSDKVGRSLFQLKITPDMYHSSLW